MTNRKFTGFSFTFSKVADIFMMLEEKSLNDKSLEKNFLISQKKNGFKKPTRNRANPGKISTDSNFLYLTV